MFDFILDFLRGQELVLEHLLPDKKAALLLDAKFYQLDDLVKLVNASPSPSSSTLSSSSSSSVSSSNTRFPVYLVGKFKQSTNAKVIDVSLQTVIFEGISYYITWIEAHTFYYRFKDGHYWYYIRNNNGYEGIYHAGHHQLIEVEQKVNFHMLYFSERGDRGGQEGRRGKEEREGREEKRRESILMLNILA